MKKTAISCAFCLISVLAFSQDSMNKKMENKTDNMNKKMENKTDKMNKKIDNKGDSIKSGTNKRVDTTLRKTRITRTTK
ncbi:MAG: hypothetical protein WKF89_13115 [Chitinophagaceae bacterium]